MPKTIGLLIGCLLLVICFMASIVYGQTKITWSAAITSFIQYDQASNEHIIVQTTRLPRAVIAVVIGISLAIAGALMQALTRNPLSSPDLLGINTGAAFFVVFAVTVLSISSMSVLMWAAFAGAGVASFIVFALASLGREGLTPLKIVLAGAALTALFSSFIQGLLVLDEQGLDQVLLWLTGGIAGRTMDMLVEVFPYVGAGWVIALLLGKHINVLLMGDDAAKGLGQRVLAVKLLAGAAYVVLAGGSVAIAWPIGFIGLVVPHIARYFAGVDFRWLLPYCAVIGGCLLLLADVAARFIIMPEELPVGIVTALIGTPFFIYIARRGRFAS